MQPRHTARGIVIHHDQILLMERWRDGLHYFSIPGGGIEANETAEQAVVRELLEETSVAVTTVRPVIIMQHGAIRHTIFLCDYLSGEPRLVPDSEEAQDDPAFNRFLPRWVPIAELASIPFVYWEPVRGPLVAGLATGFASQPQVVMAAEAG